MSMKLPYFNFNSDDWLTGDITLETYKAQGVFISVCAYYWKRDCDISFTHLKKRFRDVKNPIWDVFLSKKFLKVSKSETVSISFLDKQRQKLEKKRQSNALNGAKNAEKRWQPHKKNIASGDFEVKNKSKISTLEEEIEIEEEIDKKEKNKQKKMSLIALSNFFQNKEFTESWKSWNEVRKKKKCSFSDSATKRAVNKLLKLSNNNQETAIAILNQSADSGWSDLYKLKNDSPNTQDELNRRYGNTMSATDRKRIMLEKMAKQDKAEIEAERLENEKSH